LLPRQYAFWFDIVFVLALHPFNSFHKAAAPMLRKFRVALQRRRTHGYIVALLLALSTSVFLLGANSPGRTWWWLLAWLMLCGAALLSVLSPHIESHLLIQQGAWLVALGRGYDAVRLASQAVSLTPYNVHAFIVRSNAYVLQGQIDMAVDDADHAVRINRHLPEARLARARVYSLRGLHDDAVKDLRIGLERRTNWLVGYFEIARMYLRMDDYEGCISILFSMQKQKKHPDLAYEAMNLAGWVYLHKMADSKHAIACYSLAIKTCPERRQAYLGRAFAYRQQRDFLQAAEDYLQAAHSNPSKAEKGFHHLHKAFCYWSRYCLTQNEEDFTKVISALDASQNNDSSEAQLQARAVLATIGRVPIIGFLPKMRIYQN
jgi:tetratricopeptide (TPR) repeat protein